MDFIFSIALADNIAQKDIIRANKVICAFNVINDVNNVMELISINVINANKDITIISPRQNV